MRFVRALLPYVAFAAMTACFPVHAKVIADGTDGNLEFNGFDSKETLPLEVPIELSVARFDAQWNTCVIMKNEGVHPQGCSSDPEPITWITGACEDPSICSVEFSGGQRGGALLVHVTGHAEGSTRVRVSVKSANDSANWSDALPVTFLKATKMVLDGTFTKYAFFPGKSFHWCATLQNVTGDVTTNLFTPSSAVSTSIDGTSLVEGNGQAYATSCLSFHAVSAGKTAITVHAGPLDRTVSVRIADPNAVTAMEIRTLASRDPADPLDADEDPLLDATVVKSILLDSASYDPRSFTSVVTLTDGTLALGMAGRLTASPKDLATVYGGADPPIAESSFSLSPSYQGGKGTLEADLGAVHFSIPLEVVDAKYGRDAGRD